MASVLFAFTYVPCHSTTPKSSTYSISHNYSFVTNWRDTSGSTTNKKGLSADHCCKPTVTWNSADTSHSVLTLAVSPLYISSTKFKICPRTLFILSHQNVTSMGTLSNAFANTSQAQYRLLFHSKMFYWTCLAVHNESVVPFCFMNPNYI